MRIRASTALSSSDLVYAVSRLLSFVIYFSAAWTFLVQFSYLAGFSFNLILILTPLVGLLSGALTWRCDLFESLNIVEMAREGRDNRLLITGLAVGGATYLSARILPDFALAIFLLSIGLGAIALAKRYSGRALHGALGAEADTPLTAGAIVIIVLGLGLFSLFTYRSDADDAFFVGLAATALEHRYAPLHQVDGLIGGSGITLGAWYGLHSAETFVAMIAALTGQQPYTVAHSVVGPMCSSLAALAFWRIMRACLPPLEALVGLVSIVCVILFWGEVHRSYGNFGFVRIFQGKGQFVTLWAPLIFFFAWSYVRTGSRTILVAVSLCLLAGVGASSTALIMGPFAALIAGGCGLLAGQLKTSLVRLLILVLGTIVFVAANAALHLQTTISAGLPATERIQLIASDSRTMFGGAHRAAFTFAALAVLPFLATGWRSKVAFGSLLCGLALWFFTPLPALILAGQPPNLAWRSAWSIPAPVLIGLIFGWIALRLRPLPAWSRMLVPALFLLVFALPLGSWTFSANNRNVHIGAPTLERDPTLAELVEILDSAGADHTMTALAPEPIAWRMAAWLEAPRPQIPRAYYIRTISRVHPHYGDDRQIRAVWRCFNNARCNEQILRNHLQLHAPDLLVLESSSPAADLVSDFAGPQYHRTEVRQYSVWVRAETRSGLAIAGATREELLNAPRDASK